MRAGDEMQVRVLEHQSKEFGVLVGQLQIQFFVVILALFSPLLKEHDDGEWKTNDGHHVAKCLEPFERRHSLL